jgi:hypothetical protein
LKLRNLTPERNNQNSRACAADRIGFAAAEEMSAPLAAHTDDRRIDFIALITHGLLRGCA